MDKGDIGSASITRSDAWRGWKHWRTNASWSEAGPSAAKIEWFMVVGACGSKDMWIDKTSEFQVKTL